MSVPFLFRIRPYSFHFRSVSVPFPFQTGLDFAKKGFQVDPYDSFVCFRLRTAINVIRQAASAITTAYGRMSSRIPVGTITVLSLV
jgi:hypothetical protein